MIPNPLHAVLRAPTKVIYQRDPVMGIGTLTPVTFCGRLAPAPGARFNLIRNTFDLPTVVTTAGWAADIGSISGVSAAGGTVSGVGYLRCVPSGGSIQVRTAYGLDTPMFRRSASGAYLPHTASIYVYHTAGANRTIQLTFQAVNPDGTLVNTIGGQSLSVPTNTLTRLVGTGTPTGARVKVAVVATMTEDIWLSQPMVEQSGSVGDFFSVNTTTWMDFGSLQLNKTVALDPRTSYQAAAANQIHVSNVGFLIEDERTQWVTNPWCAVDVAGRTAVNGVGARSTAQALQGPASYQLTASAANAADTVSIAPGSGVEVQLHAIVLNTAGATRSVRMTVDGVAVSGASATVANNGMAELRGTFTGSGAARTVAVEWTDSANTNVFYTLYFGAIGNVLNIGGGGVGADWGSTPMPEISALIGTIQEGFSWTGTAHASTSQSTPANEIELQSPISGDDVTSALMSQTGAIAVQFASPGYAIDQADYLAELASLAFVTGGSIQDWARITILDDSATGRRGAGPSVSADTVTVSTNHSADTVQTIVFEWNKERAAIYHLENGVSTVDTAFTLFPDPEDVGARYQQFQIAVASAGTITGPVMQVAFFTGPLDATIRDTLRTTTHWTTTMLDNVTLPWTDLTCIAVDDGAGVVA